MIRKLIGSLCLLTLSAVCAQKAAPKAAAAQPKLVLAITVDQFRYDYLTRFREHYNSGLDRLLRQGAVFTNAHYEHFPTVTAIGHSTFLSGATPSISGIGAVVNIQGTTPETMVAGGQGDVRTNLLVNHLRRVEDVRPGSPMVD